jgi:hypothetical protein
MTTITILPPCPRPTMKVSILPLATSHHDRYYRNTHFLRLIMAAIPVKPTALLPL